MSEFYVGILNTSTGVLCTVLCNFLSEIFISDVIVYRV
jgi:hypothetical protein